MKLLWSKNFETHIDFLDVYIYICQEEKKWYPLRLILLEDGKIKKKKNLQKWNVNCLEKSGGKDRLPSGSVTTICFFIDVDFFCSDAILFVFISIYGNIPFFVIET